MTFHVNYITYLLVTLMSSVVRYSGHYNLILRTIQYYIPKLSYSNGIQHGAVSKIDFMGQTKALVKTNSTTLQLPLLITKANITPLMGLDWMKRLGITLNTTTDDIKIHNTKMDETEKKILRLKNEFNIVLQQHGNKRLGSKNRPERRRKNNTAKGKTSTNSPSKSSSGRNKKTNKKRILGKGHRNNRRLFREPGSHHGEERQINKNCTGFKKIK